MYLMQKEVTHQVSTQYLGDKPNEGAIRIVTFLNGEHGDVIVNKKTLGFDKEIIKKSDVGHEHNYADSAISVAFSFYI